MNYFFAVLVAASLTGSKACAERPVINSASQLPTHSYRIAAKPSETLSDPAALRALASKVDADTAATLAVYDVRDSSALRSLYETRAMMALLLDRPEDAVAWSRKAAAAESKEALRLTAGLDIEGAAAAAGRPSAERNAAYRTAILARLGNLPSAVVRPRVIELRRSLDLLSLAYRRAEVTMFSDPVWAKSPDLDADGAFAVLEVAYQTTFTDRYRQPMREALTEWIKRHPTGAAKDIWPERSFNLTGTSDIGRVAIAVWDGGGVDPDAYPGQVLVNSKETVNGLDDDGNGFIDDVAGIAFAENYSPEAGPLRAVPAEVKPKLAEYEEFMRGRGDLSTGIDTPASAFTRRRLAELTERDVPDFDRGYYFYRGHIHGTHVAGIAIAGNRLARIVPVRVSFSNADIPPPIEEAGAAAFATMAKEAVRYMRLQGVRVCNMSWGYTAANIEQMLSINNIEPDAKRRRTRAQAIFDVMFDGMSAAMASAPDILFVIAAGNANENIDFVRDMPGSINLPNVLSVGAVDEAGALTSFASTGSSVDLYANGYNVVSKVPGGGKIMWSGASLAAPQVVNAAAKLIALKPDLKTVQVVDLLTRGATPLPGSKLPLLNAARSRELMAALKL